MEWDWGGARAGAGGLRRPRGLGRKDALDERAQPELETEQSPASGCTPHPKQPFPGSGQCACRQVIYRAAQDPHSSNVVHELVFPTLRHELRHTTLKIQLPQQDVWHKSKIFTARRGVGEHAQRGSDSPKVTLPTRGAAEKD